MSNVHSDSQFRDEFLTGAARAFFTMAYVEYVESVESGDIEDDYDYPRAGSGEAWEDYVPSELPPNAFALAGQLWAQIAALNGAAGVYTLNARATEADGVVPDAEKFGWYLAMEAMGHGVSWFDNHASFDSKLPHMDVGSLTFDPEAYRG